MDDRDHVLVFHQLGVVGNVSVAGHEQRPPRFQDQGHRGNRDLQQVVERRQFALDAAAPGRIDHRELVQVQDVAGGNHVGAAKMHHAVAVGVGAGLAHDDNAVVVDVHRSHSGRVRLVRPVLVGQHALVGHAQQHVLVRKNVCVGGGAKGSARDRDARARQRMVAAGVVGIGTGVDDQPDRPVGDRPHRGQDLVRHLRGAAVHENGRVFADVHGDVAPGAEDHVDVRPDLNGFQRGFARCRLGVRHGDPARGKCRHHRGEAAM